MDDYEVYAGKGMVIVKATYLRHSYSWSDHSITGEKLGWGIIASSTPEDSRLLRELEKLASAAMPDYRSRIPVEMLLYSPICGYVKMTAMARKGGNAGRKNKMVRLFQLEASPVTPASYLAPGDSWDPPRKGQELLPVTLEVPLWDRSVFLQELGGDPDVIRALMAMVYRTVTGDIRQLNLLAPDWKQEEFAGRSRLIMGLIHEMLPEKLRRRAGYISFAREKIRRIPFVFSKRPLGEDTFSLGGLAGQSGDSRDALTSRCEDSALIDAFFHGLAHDFMENPESFDRFLEQADALLEGRSGSRNQLVRLAYLYLGQPGHEELIPPLSRIQEDIPELLYWDASDEDYGPLVERILDVLHRETPTRKLAARYMKTLAAGCTKRNMEKTAAEVGWLIHETGTSDREIDSLTRELAKESQALYDYMVNGEEKRSQVQPDNKMDHKKEENISANRAGEGRSVPKTGTGEESLQIRSLSERAGRIDRERIRRKPAEPLGSGKESDTRTAEVRTVEDGMEESLTFLITGIVQGFVTGCMLYLAHYTMKLGRWKIALGLLGIWIPVMVNYWYILRQKGEWRPLWKIWGLCLAEGLIIEITAWFFPTQKMRLTFFVVLGVLVLLVQLLGILRLFTKNKK